jgi:putative acetyltransferase
MIKLIRTDSANLDFQKLVTLLDQDLQIRDGEEHDFYAQFNKTDKINNVVVAYFDEKPVGCGAFKNYTAETVEIKRMFVKLENRGQRIAKQVLDELEIWANELGYSTFILETGTKQPEAIRLYQREGYEVIPNYGQYEGVENSVCMQKVL